MRAQLCLPFVKTLFVSRRRSAATKQFEYLRDAKCRSSRAVDWYEIVGCWFVREGLRMGHITPAQRAAVMTLLQAALSRDGYQKVTDIMHGDEVLRTTGDGRGGRAGGGPAFGEAQYYLAFLGTPSTTSPWMLQF